jgi:hypothetical protein
MSKKDIELLQGYYHFLYLGKFLEQHIQENDLTKQVHDTKITTGKSTHFIVKKEKIQRLLNEIHKHPDKQNVL